MVRRTDETTSRGNSPNSKIGWTFPAADRCQERPRLQRQWQPLSSGRREGCPLWIEARESWHELYPSASYDSPSLWPRRVQKGRKNLDERKSYDCIRPSTPGRTDRSTMRTLFRTDSSCILLSIFLISFFWFWCFFHKLALSDANRCHWSTCFTNEGGRDEGTRDNRMTWIIQEQKRLKRDHTRQQTR